MHNDLLLDIAVVLGLGMFAQWAAWRLRQPSIIFLLLFGLSIGPVSALILGRPLLDIDYFLGDLLFPVVSASVAVILFEGGLSLRVRDLEGTGGVVSKLVTVGVLVTWLISAVAAFWLFDVGVEIALLLGATLVVTGPTVIIPLLKQIRPKGRVGSILRWEGIVIDPIGAILAVLVFEEIIAGPDILLLVQAIFLTLVVGGGIGFLAAQVMIEVYRRYWVPDKLQNPVTLGIVLAAFTLANIVQPESGLLTVTVMGITMANQQRLDIRHIIEFKETLQVLLLSSLFILLSARMSAADMMQIGWPTLVFVLIIILIERPLAALFSTWGSELTWKERVFIGWMAPRGIVAASVASIFALELSNRGIEGAEILLPVTFAVIIGTVATYSLTSGVLARQLGLSERNPQGVLIVGANRWIREVAKAIRTAGFRVLLADTNQAHAERARGDQLEIYHGNILSEAAQDDINFGGIGRLLAMTPNAEVNALAGEHYQATFGPENVFELQRVQAVDDRAMISDRLGGRRLFPSDMTYDVLYRRFQNGARVMIVTVDDPQALQAVIPDPLLPLFVLPGDDRLLIWTEVDSPVLRKGYRLIAMLQPDAHRDLLARGIITSGSDDQEAQNVPDLAPQPA